MTTIDDVRKYWDQRPCNIRHSPVDIDKHPYLYSQQVTNRKYFVESHIPRFVDFSYWRDKFVLELGCGIGTDTISFAAHGANVVAVDISEESLEIARKRAKALGLQSKIIFMQGNIEKLYQIRTLRPWCAFDLVYSFGAIHHTPCPPCAVQGLQTYMYKDSILKVMLYHRYTSKVFSALVRHWRPGMSVDDAVAKMSEAQCGCPVTYTYNKRSATKLLRDFEILDMHVDHIFPYKVSEYVNYRYIHKRPWSWMPPRVFHWFERNFGWHLLITARSK